MAIKHAQPPATPASLELEAVKREIDQLQLKEKQRREHLSRISLQTAQQLQASGNNNLDLAERPLPSLLQEATILDAGVKYFDALEDLQHTVAGLRDGLSGMQALLEASKWDTYLTAVLQEPLQHYKHVHTASNAFMEVSTIGLPDRLIRQGSKALSKGKQAQDAMLGGLNRCLEALLKQVAWPPALASDSSLAPRSSKRPRSEMEAETDPGAANNLDGDSQAATGAAAEGQQDASSWDGFDAAGPVVSTGLQQCVQGLVACQQGVLESANFPVDQLPILEVIQTITQPLLAKLRFHFATGRPTDRIDQPDWLFQTAVQLTKDHYEAFKLLQPAVDAHGLGQTFFLPWEFAHAMRAAVQTVLKEHVLPRLTQQGTQDLWTFYADAAVAFEKSMSVLRGVYIEESQMDHDGPFAWGRGSCLELACSRDSWRDAWLRGESEDGQEQLEDLVDRMDAWDPAPSVRDPLTDSKDNKAQVAWQEEFWPPTIAEFVVHLVWTLCKRALWLYDPELRQAYVSAVPKAVLRTFRSKLARMAKVPDDLRAVLSPEWTPRIACYCNTCHYMEYHLQQSHLSVLLLSDPSSSQASSPQQGSGSTQPTLATPSLTPHMTPSNKLLWTPQSSVFTSPANSLAEVTGQSHVGMDGTHGSLGAFDSEASAFGSFWKKWSLKLAKETARQFRLDCRSYMYKSHLAEFANTSCSQEDGDETVSVQLKAALMALDATLKLLAQCLDAVVFRETWKAIAVAVNRQLYNEVATEARFSFQGGRQLACDAQTLFTVFQPYTFKPAAHFKELRDASVLLALEPDAMNELVTLLQASTLNVAKQKLKEIGVLRLSPDQALGVLEQRI